MITGGAAISPHHLNDTLFNKLVPTLHEDDQVIAVAKPVGVDVGGSPGSRSPGLAGLLAQVRGLGETLHPINRLSRDESGIVLLPCQ